MEPMYGLILILLWAGLNALIANKRGRSGTATFAWSVMPAIPVSLFVTYLTHNEGSLAGWSAFIPPAAGLITAIVMANGKEAAVRTGSFGDYVKCPYCAEPVRREAIKCRHCGSSLTPKPARKAA